MTSSPDLIHELRASRPSAPLELRARIREIAAVQTSEPRRWPRLTLPIRRVAMVAVPAMVALAFVSAGVLGLSRSDIRTDAQRQESLATRAADQSTPNAYPVLPEQTDAARSGEAPAYSGPAPTGGTGRAGALEGDRAQRVSAALTVEVADADAVSQAAQETLALTRRLGGFVVSSSVATGEDGSASITVRVPVDRVQDAIAGLSALGRIVTQQVTVDDLQQTLDELEAREAGVRGRIARIQARLRTETLDAQTEAVLRARLQTSRAELVGLRTGIASTESEASMSTIQLAIVTPRASGAIAPPSRIDRTIDEALNILAWEAVVALGILIVLAPFALVALAAWLGRRLYRRHEDERLLAAS